MSIIDVVILVLGLVLASLGIAQLATGKNIIGGFAMGFMKGQSDAK